MKLNTEAIICTRCHRFGGVVLVQVGGSMLPTNWSHHTSGGRGMTGYTATDTLCDSCTREQRERDEEEWTDKHRPELSG